MRKQTVSALSRAAKSVAPVRAALATASLRTVSTAARAPARAPAAFRAAPLSRVSGSPVASAALLPAATVTASAPARAFSAGSYPDHVVLSMPALSPTMESGGLASWEKKEGDEVSAGDALAQVETDKATVSFDSTEDGFIAKILVPAGTQNIAVGTPVAIMVENAEDVAAFKDYAANGAAPAAPAAAAAAPEAASAPAAAAAAPAAGAAAAPTASTTAGGRVLASPAAKALAAERGIDIAQVAGTGPGHRVIRADVAEFTPAPAAAPAAATAAAAAPAAAAAVAAPVAAPAAAWAPTGDYVDTPLTGMRRVIAQRLTQSKQTVPHYYVTMEIKMDAVNALRAKLNKKLAAAAAPGEKPAKLSVNDFVIKATAAALRKVPAVNVMWAETAVRQYNYVDISVAVATETGLITPIVTDADTKGLSAISNEMKSLAGRARAGKLQPQEYQGGCFTISNLGMFGVQHFSAIINAPQSGILAVGGSDVKVIPNPAAATDPTASPFTTATVMSVTASFDHRVIDGAVGAQWLDAFKGYMEDPTSMLL